MPALPPRLSLEQVRRLAKDLLRDLKDGDRAAIRRLAVVSAPSTLAGAQLAIAREYGFPSWARLKRDVELREILDSLDVGRLRALVAEEPDLASTTMEHWVDHPAGASPLGYVAMLRYDTTRGIWREVDGAGAIAGILVAAGAPVDGQKGVPETPLITAASYGDAGVACSCASAVGGSATTGRSPTGCCRRSRSRPKPALRSIGWIASSRNSSPRRRAN